MALALASTWTMFLAFGSLACIGPISYTVGMAYQNAFSSGLSYSSQPSAFGFLASVNSIMFIVLGFVIGYPVASASGKISLLLYLLTIWRFSFQIDFYWKQHFNYLQLVGEFSLCSLRKLINYSSHCHCLCICIFTVNVLQGLWRNDLVSLKGACPNCGEEVSSLSKWDNIHINVYICRDWGAHM